MNPDLFFSVLLFPIRKDGSYGYRCMVETVFSHMKRMFGEYVYAIQYLHMLKEVLSKASLYNMFAGSQ